MVSLVEPFFTTSPTLRFSHLNPVLCFDNALFQIAQDSTMVTSSFAIMSMWSQSVYKCSWNHLPLKCAPQPQHQSGFGCLASCLRWS